MLKHIIYVVVFIFILNIGKCQDIIIKNDSTRITNLSVKEVNPYLIKYQIASDTSKSIFELSKQEVAYILFKNGIVEKISRDNYVDPPKNSKKVFLRKKDSIIWNLKPRDYINFNLELGGMINNNYANGSARKPQRDRTSSRGDYVYNDKKHNSSINLGFNFIFGRGPVIKHVVGLNYLRSNGQYIYKSSSIGYRSDLLYTSKLDFLNFTSGFSFTILNRLKLQSLLAINTVIHSDISNKGYVRQTVSNYPTYRDTVFYISGKEKADFRFTFSTIQKIEYNLKIKERYFGIYYAFNYSPFVRLPWHMFGMSYYPFQKLSPSVSSYKLKFTNKKTIHSLNIEAGAIINNYELNTDNNRMLEGDFRKYKLGYHAGANYYYGKTSVVKHFFHASIIQSNAEFSEKKFKVVYDNSLKQEHETLYTKEIQSSVLLLNIGTGIKFIMYKRFHFDNGLIYTRPFYSVNNINEYQIYTLSDRNTYQVIYTSTSPITKSTSNQFFLSKNNFVIHAKLAYEFNIKQNKIGLFAAWNRVLSVGSQWFVAGLTYYPLKKLY